MGSQSRLSVRRSKTCTSACIRPRAGCAISAPTALGDDAIRQVVASKLDWIRKQQARLAGREQQDAPQYVSGESHEYGGRRYVLNVVYRDGPPGVRLRDGTTVISASGRAATRRSGSGCCWAGTAQLREMIPTDRPVGAGPGRAGCRVGREGDEGALGQLQHAGPRIWLNLDLVRKPPSYLEYVVVHEMVHLLEPGHGRGVTCALMDRFLPAGGRRGRR